MGMGWDGWRVWLSGVGAGEGRSEGRKEEEDGGGDGGEEQRGEGSFGFLDLLGEGDGNGSGSRGKGERTVGSDCTILPKEIVGKGAVVNSMNYCFDSIFIKAM